MVQLHKNINKLDGMDIEMFVISRDSPEELLSLHNKLEETYGHSLPFISDPNLKLIDKMGMKKNDMAYRGYGMIDKEGNIIFTTKDDHWGEQIEKTVAKIKEEYNKLK
ncbi:redoxin domain-containing protein [Neobacillus cucumis]|uniref:redoxin domain-containing protein n=1 Tax=Neobacillus cucumis TaxID=1740721 RepID=UPI0018E0244B|nr:redoxin domain-containing protein [Neobacillus cucumis]MBI0579673.1 redoxin domain-containing protein [Neobacillus cucumis]